MENLKPFIEGTKNIDDSALDGVAKIGDMMLKLTGARILVADIGNMFAALQNAVAPAGGLLQAIIGTKNLGNLGTQASQFVDSLKSVADLSSQLCMVQSWDWLLQVYTRDLSGLSKVPTKIPRRYSNA